MSINKSLLSFMMLIGSATAFAEASNVQHLLWSQDILNVNIPLNQEKIIEVCSSNSTPDKCTPVSMTPYLPENVVGNGGLQSINNAGVLYLTATQPFSNQLAELKLDDSQGTVVLVRLTATQTANQDHIEILLPPSSSTTSQGSGHDSSDKTLGDKVRWVAEQLYAPDRLLTQPNWIFRVPMRTAQFVPLYRDTNVTAMPLASWQSGDEFITAVLLRNNQKSEINSKPIILDFNLLRGQWVAASFFREGLEEPKILEPEGSGEDSTTLILVSSMPFDQALNSGGQDE